MNLQSKYTQDENGVKFAPITTPNAIRWPDGSNLSDKLSALDAVVIEAPVNTTDATLPITSLACEVDKYYRIDVAVDTLAVTLPAMTDLTTVRTVVIYLTAGTTPAITISSTAVSGGTAPAVYYQDGFKIEAGKTYEINALFNGDAWVVDALTIKILFFVKLTLNNGEVVELQGSGALTSAMVSPYKSSVVSAEIGELCTSIGEYAFDNCTGLTSITIPESVTSIGNGAFAQCGGLTSITIPEGVTSIGSYAFNGCRGLTSVSIPESVTSIGSYAFSGCSALTSVTIPNSVTSIGYGAFYGCFSLTTIVVEEGNSYYDSRNNCNAIIETASNTLIAGCQNTVIPESVTSIGYGAFAQCGGLTSITIPEGVTSIGEFAFARCGGLTSITIPNSVTSIGDYAFDGCTGLTSVISLATTAPIIKSDTFRNVKTGGTLTVPSGSSGYDVWMGTGDYYLGKYNWTKVEQ